MNSSSYIVPRYKKRSLWLDIPLLMLAFIGVVLMCAGCGILTLINKPR